MILAKSRQDIEHVAFTGTHGTLTPLELKRLNVAQLLNFRRKAQVRNFFCKAQAMIAERKILLCKLLSSGESETIEIKPCSTIVYILGVSGKRFRQLTEK